MEPLRWPESHQRVQSGSLGRPPTPEPLRRPHSFRPGDPVTTHTRNPRWNQRTGRVATTNAGEIGVTFTANETPDAWFHPTELRKERA